MLQERGEVEDPGILSPFFGSRERVAVLVVPFVHFDLEAGAISLLLQVCLELIMSIGE